MEVRQKSAERERYSMQNCATRSFLLPLPLCLSQSLPSFLPILHEMKGEMSAPLNSVFREERC